MLTTLRVSGFAIVDEVEVELGPGLNVFTGETGAGKSILVEALHLVLGGRMSADVLRDGADQAVVEALFQVPPDHPVLARLAAAGIPAGAARDEQRAAGPVEILVRRTAPRGGRGRAFVNGALCTVALLESTLRGLVDVTGQHEHVELLDEGTHLALLDAYARGKGAGKAGAATSPGPGGPAEDPLPERYRSAHAELAAALRDRERLVAASEERARRRDYLAYQLRELDDVSPRPGEEVELERERQVLSSAEKLRQAASEAEALAYGGEGSAAERLARAARLAGDAAAVDPRLGTAAAALRSALAEVEDAGRSLARYAEEGGGDPARLAEVEERLDGLRSLARKHGGSLEAALARAEAMRAELAEVEGGSERLATLDGVIAAAGARAVALAAELSRVRSDAARRFARDVRRELEALAMERCRIELALLPPESPLVHAGVALGPDGAERVHILLGPNPGEPARPLARVASGGELSRVLLALKRALARADPVSTYVFDEVDAGIGGKVAEAVGRLLSEISRERQVICVTHLPQVAAFADRHLEVHKETEGGRTSARVTPLDAERARRGEVARMLAGAKLTDSALEHAAALIWAARGTRGAAEPRPVRGRRTSAPRTAARRTGA